MFKSPRDEGSGLRQSEREKREGEERRGEERRGEKRRESSLTEKGAGSGEQGQKV